MPNMLPVKHASQDLCGHNDASGIWSNGDITGHQAHVVIKLITQFPELLIAQSLPYGVAMSVTAGTFVCKLIIMLLKVCMKQSTNSHGNASLVQKAHMQYDATHSNPVGSAVCCKTWLYLQR